MLPSTTAFILAGGRSSRMGTDKAFLRLGNTTLLEHAIATMRDVAENVVLVGDRQRLGAHNGIVEDDFPSQGPLAGIHAALSSAYARDLNLMLAVDTPAVTPDLLHFLLHRAKQSMSLVTVPRANGHTQPLCAVYRREFAAIAEEALRTERNKIDPLFAVVETTIVEEAELKTLGFSPDIFDNVNTPEDWQRMKQRFGVTQE